MPPAGAVEARGARPVRTGDTATSRRPRTARRARPALVGALLAALLGTAGCASGAEQDRPVLQAPEPTTAAGPEGPTTPAPAPPLITAPPDEHSQVGALVSGFPEDLLPVPDDAAVLVTSAVPVGDSAVQEVSLNLRTAAGVQEIVDLYRTALTQAGFTELPSAAATSDLAAEATFVRSGGDELVSIGVLDDGAARTVTVGGRVRTAA